MALAAQSAWMFDGAHVHRLEAKHKPTHVNRGGGSAAMYRLYIYIPLRCDVSSIFLYSPRCDGGFMHLQSTEESDNKVNPRSMTTRPDLLLRLLVLRATAPFGRCACADCAHLRKAEIHALRNKIRGWCESAFCA